MIIVKCDGGCGEVFPFPLSLERVEGGGFTYSYAATLSRLRVERGYYVADKGATVCPGCVANMEVMP